MFGLCQIHSFIDYVRANMSKENFATLTKTISIAIATVISGGVGVMTLSGKVAPWTGRFYSLLDPSYAKNNIPIIASVSEHQPTAWSSFYFDLQVLISVNNVFTKSVLRKKGEGPCTNCPPIL